MATQTMSASRPSRSKQISVRKISNEDLRLSLKQGLEDFRDLRGDIFFAGLIYTLIGIAAVVMTASAPLMPFFLPVVAGVGLLGPVAAVGFYELAERREEGETNLHWFNFLDVRKRSTVDDMDIAFVVRDRLPDHGLTRASRRIAARQLAERNASVDEVAGLIGVDPRTVWRWRREDREAAA